MVFRMLPSTHCSGVILSSLDFCSTSFNFLKIVDGAVMGFGTKVGFEMAQREARWAADVNTQRRDKVCLEVVVVVVV